MDRGVAGGFEAGHLGLGRRQQRPGLGDVDLGAEARLEPHARELHALLLGLDVLAGDEPAAAGRRAPPRGSGRPRRAGSRARRVARPRPPPRWRPRPRRSAGPAPRSPAPSSRPARPGRSRSRRRRPAAAWGCSRSPGRGPPCPSAVTVGTRSAAAMPRSARASRTRAVATFRSRLAATARSTSRSRTGSWKVRHQSATGAIPGLTPGCSAWRHVGGTGTSGRR